MSIIYLVVFFWVLFFIEKKWLIKIFFISFMPLNSLSFVLYNGLNYPDFHVLALPEIILVILFIKSKIKISKNIILINLAILIFLFWNLPLSSNYGMYFWGIIRGFLIPFCLYFILKSHSLKVQHILIYVSYSILIGYIISIAMLFLRGNSFNDIIFSEYLRAYGYTYVALGGVNPFAGLALLLIPFFIYYRVYLGTIILYIILSLTFTRGAVIIGVVQFLLMLGSNIKIDLKQKYIIILGLLFIIIMNFNISSRFENFEFNNIFYSISNQNNALTRFIIWEKTIDIFKSATMFQKYFGLGFSTFRDNTYFAGLYNGQISTPHSLFLWVLYNFGYIGLLLLILSLSMLIKHTIKEKKYYILISIVSFLIYGITVGVALFPEYREYSNIYLLGYSLIFYSIYKPKNEI